MEFNFNHLDYQLVGLMVESKNPTKGERVEERPEDK